MPRLPYPLLFKRDVLISEVPLVFQPETHLYATAAMCGASLCVAMVGAGAPLSLATLVGALVVLALRLAGIYWRIFPAALEEPINTISLNSIPE